MYTAEFVYDKRGYGNLIFFKEGKPSYFIYCRTGYIDKAGNLKNAIYPGAWTGKEPPVTTTEEAMMVGDFGYKFRLWTPEGKWSRYLIHPDGGKPGSEGCIVSQTDHQELYDMLYNIMMVQESLTVEVKKT